MQGLIMKELLKKYLFEFREINSICKKYLFLYMIQAISAGVGFFIAVYLEVHLKLPAHIIGYIVSIYVAGNFFGSTISAKILDFSSPLKLSGISLFSQGLCFAILCLTNSILLISFVMFILGVFCYIFAIANNYFIPIASGQTDEEQARSISLLSVSSNIGIGIGGALVSLLSNQYPILLFALMSITLLLSSRAYFKQDIKLSSSSSNKECESSVSVDKQNYFLSLFVIFILGLIFAQKRVSYSLFLEDYFGSNEASFLFLLNPLLIIFFLPSVTKLCKNYERRMIIGIGCILLGGGLFLLQYTSLFMIAIIICIITTFGEMLGSVFSQLMCFQSSSSAHKGRAMGYYKLLYALGAFIGSSIGGNIQEYFGTNVVWNVCGLLGFVLFAVCFIFSNLTQKAPVLVS
jgi:predicted MFS family arabinose efflux permease